MRWQYAPVVWLVGCYSPAPPTGAPCPDEICPSGQVCVAGRCTIGAGGPGGPGGSGSGVPDAAIDGPSSGTPSGPPTALTGQRWLVPCKGTVPNEPDLCQAIGDVHSVSLSGTPAQHYMVTIRVRGVMEVAPYIGGTAPGGGWYVGGSINDDFHSDIQLMVSSPPANYHLNYAAADPDVVVKLDYLATFPIDGGALALFVTDTQDTVQLLNKDINGVPLTVPEVATTPSPYNGQYIQIDVVSVK
jgi:hypothetical protein